MVLSEIFDQFNFERDVKKNLNFKLLLYALILQKCRICCISELSVAVQCRIYKYIPILAVYNSTVQIKLETKFEGQLPHRESTCVEFKQQQNNMVSSSFALTDNIILFEVSHNIGLLIRRYIALSFDLTFKNFDLFFQMTFSLTE